MGSSLFRPRVVLGLCAFAAWSAGSWGRDALAEIVARRSARRASRAIATHGPPREAAARPAPRPSRIEYATSDDVRWEGLPPSWSRVRVVGRA